MSTEKTYQANPVVSCGVEEDGAILYNPDTDGSSIINLSGLELWNLFQTPKTVSEIAEYLVHTYREVTIEQAAEDTKLFIDTLTPDFLSETE